MQDYTVIILVTDWRVGERVDLTYIQYTWCVHFLSSIKRLVFDQTVNPLAVTRTHLAPAPPAKNRKGRRHVKV